MVLERNYDFTVNYLGRMNLFLKKDRSRDRIGQDYTILVNMDIEHKAESGKVTKKKVNTDSFIAALEPLYKQTEQSYEVSITGGAKVLVSMKYDGERITLDAKIGERGELTEGDLSVVFRVVVPGMYPSSYDTADKRKLKDKMRRDQFKITRASDGETLSLKSYEMVNLNSDSVAEAGFTSLMSEIGAQEGKKLIFTSVSGTEVLKISSKSNEESMLWKGYTVRWESSFGKRAPSPLVIQVK